MSIPHSTFSISIPQLMKVSKYLLERTHTHAFEYYQEQIPVRNVTRLKVGKQGILQIHNNCLTDANKRGYIDKSRYLMLSCGAMGHQIMVNGKQAQWKGNLYESQGQQVRRGELIPDQFLVNFKNKFNIFALYQFFFNSLPPSPSYLILFSLLPFLSILFDSYPFSTQLLYIPTSLSFGSYSYFHSLIDANKCLTSFSAFAYSLYPICFLSLFPQPLFDAIMQWFPLFSLLPSLSLSLISNNLILFIPIFNST